MVCVKYFVSLQIISFLGVYIVRAVVQKVEKTLNLEDDLKTLKDPLERTKIPSMKPYTVGCLLDLLELLSILSWKSERKLNIYNKYNVQFKSLKI